MVSCGALWELLGVPYDGDPRCLAVEVCGGSAPEPVPHAPPLMSVPGSTSETEVNIHSAPKGRSYPRGIICTPGR